MIANILINLLIYWVSRIDVTKRGLSPLRLGTEKVPFGYPPIDK